MPAFLGGLPGAALAMYHCARPENRHKIKGLLISGVIACVVGGTTEPIEFLFLFVAPVLYLIHAVLTGLGFTVMAVLGVTIGNTDGNVIDFVVFGILHGLSTKWYLVPVVAAIWFAVYYGIFRFAITRFNLKTPDAILIRPPALNRRLPVPWANPAITPLPFWRRWAVRITSPRWITASPACVCRWRICQSGYQRPQGQPGHRRGTVKPAQFAGGYRPAGTVSER